MSTTSALQRFRRQHGATLPRMYAAIADGVPDLSALVLLAPELTPKARGAHCSAAA
ncbi:MAG: hypothetical protein IPJ04_00010 [Candidatus Eisenbacteria bacterium]|nr:hypothetical protein [Candidatus Eisenbacteria bacterium]